jgi:hypothetical protein
MMLLLPSAARAQHVHVSNFMDQGALGNCMSFDSTGCIQTDVVIFASTTRIKDASSTPTFEPILSVTYAVNNMGDPSGTVLRSGIGATDVFSFTMDDGLQNAHPTATVPVSDDQHGTTIYFYVDLVWTGVGDIDTLRLNEHVVTPAFTVDIFSGSAKARDATASGTVTDGTTNFTPPGSALFGCDVNITCLSTMKIASVAIERD